MWNGSEFLCKFPVIGHTGIHNAYLYVTVNSHCLENWRVFCDWNFPVGAVGPDLGTLLVMLVKHVLPPVDSWVSSRVPSIDAYCHPSTQVPGPGSGVYLRKLSSCWAHFIRDVHKVAEVPESLLVQWIWVFRGLCFYFFLASLISNAKEYMRIGMYIKAILNSWF